MAAKMVKCRSCQHSFDRNLNDSCPHCGSKEYLSASEETRINERREEVLRLQKEQRHNMYYARNSRITWLIRLAVSMLVISIIIMCCTIHKAKVQAEINSMVHDIEHQIKIHEYVDAYSSLKSLEEAHADKATMKRCNVLEKKIDESILDYADQFYNNQEYDYAISILKDCRKYINKQVIDDRITRYSTEVICKHLDKFSMPDDVESALLYLKTATELYDVDQEIFSNRFSTYIQMYIQQSFEKANSLADDGDYDKASAVLETLSSVVGESDEIKSKVGYYQNLWVQKMVEDKISNTDESDYFALVDCIDNLSNKYDNLDNLALNDKRDQCLEKLREDVLKEAKSVFEETGSSSQAADVIHEANLKLSQEDSVLLSYEQKYRANKPTYLYKLEPMSSFNYYYFDNETFETNIHTSYHNGIMGAKWRSDGHATYNLSGNYKSISGIWACRDNGFYFEEVAWFEIYGDDELLYTSPGLNSDAFPVEFEVNITGVQKLEIKLPGEDGYHFLADVKLMPEFSLE